MKWAWEQREEGGRCEEVDLTDSAQIGSPKRRASDLSVIAGWLVLRAAVPGPAGAGTWTERHLLKRVTPLISELILWEN